MPKRPKNRSKLAELQGALPDIFRYIRTLSKDHELSRDLTQETFIRGLTATELPSEQKAIRAWGLKVVKNLFIDETRKVRVRTEYARAEERLSDRSIKTSAQNQFTRLMLKEAFDKLSDDHREIIYLVDVLGMTYAEAGKTVGIAAGTVMSRISRARSQLLKEMTSGTIQPITRRRKADDTR
ncbi:MAG: sigma-70 family RNA polymerase sigma factor [Alphaproteobacteria bacterium]